MDKEETLRILRNFIDCTTKAYRQRTCNWCVVRDLLMNRTSTAGMTSCIAKCRELSIDPHGYNLPKEIERHKRKSTLTDQEEFDG